MNQGIEFSAVQKERVAGEEKKSCLPQLLKIMSESTDTFGDDKKFEDFMSLIEKVDPARDARNLIETLRDGKKGTRFSLKKNVRKCHRQIYFQKGILALSEMNISTEDLKKMLTMFEYLRKNPKIADQKVCYDSCRIKYNDAKGLTCLDRCEIGKTKVSLEMYEEDERDPDYIDPSICKELSLEEIRRYKIATERQMLILNKRYPRMKSVINKIIADSNKIKPKIDSNVALLRKKFSKTEDPECSKKISMLESKIKKSSKDVTRKDFSGAGTAFYVKTKSNSKFMVSAHHVPVYEEEKGSLKIPKILPMNFKEGGKSSSVNFRIRPGEYDQGRDLVAKPISKSVSGLSLIEASERPRIGQHFLASGYPGSRESKWTGYSCYFHGFIKLHSDASESRYLMHCPGITKSVSGISGGPVVGDKGRVWGVNSAELISDNYLVVSPVAEKNNKIQMGIRHRVTSDDCYAVKDNVFKNRYRCSVYPGDLGPGY